MSMCSGFLRARQQVYLIEPLGQTDDGDHAVYRQEHLKISGRPSCGSSSNTTLLYDQDQGPQVAGLFRSRSWVCSSASVVFFVNSSHCSVTYDESGFVLGQKWSFRRLLISRTDEHILCVHPISRIFSRTELCKPYFKVCSADKETRSVSAPSASSSALPELHRVAETPLIVRFLQIEGVTPMKSEPLCKYIWNAGLEFIRSHFYLQRSGPLLLSPCSILMCVDV